MSKHIILGLFLLANFTFQHHTCFAQQGKLYFSDKPFLNGADIANAKNSFKAGDEIYGMVVVEENFEEYTDEKYNAGKPFEVTYYITSADKRIITGHSVAYPANIHPKYKKQNYLFFDVAPAPEKAVNVVEGGFDRMSALIAGIKLSEILNNTSNKNPKIVFDLEFKIGYKDFAKAQIEIDYSAATKESMKAWMEKDTRANEMAKTNTTTSNDNEAADLAKSLPLPKSFSLASANGYSDPKLGKASIIAMLNKTEGVKEVANFMFVKTTAPADFDLFKTVLGEPDYKWGNRFFQFIFKDAKGRCLAAGGRIKMIYEGGGRYGNPIVIWEYADIKRDEGYREAADFKAHIVDCAKVKK